MVGFRSIYLATSYHLYLYMMKDYFQPFNGLPDGDHVSPIPPLDSGAGCSGVGSRQVGRMAGVSSSGVPPPTLESSGRYVGELRPLQGYPEVAGLLIFRVSKTVDVLGKFQDILIRRAYLEGKIVKVRSRELLDSLERLSRVVLDRTALVTEEGSRVLAKIHLGVSGEPRDEEFLPLPVRMSNEEWAKYFCELLGSPFWLGAIKKEASKVQPDCPTSSDNCGKNKRVRSRVYSRNRTSGTGRRGETHTDSDDVDNFQRKFTRGRNGKHRRQHKSSESSGSASSDSSPRRRRDDYSDSGSVGDALLRALESMGRQRDVVTPSIFEVDSGESLAEFLEEYSDYFSSRYAGSDRQRSRHLRGFLRGTILKMYDAMDGGRMTFKNLKKELVDWERSQRVDNAERNEARFENAKMEAGETLNIYAKRLERLAGGIFKGRKDRDRQLIKKFSRSVPRSFQKVLTRHDRDLPAAGARLDWSYVKKLAVGHDRHFHSDSDDYNSDVPHVDVYYSQPYTSRGPEPRIQSGGRQRSGETSTRSRDDDVEMPPRTFYNNQRSPRRVSGNRELECHWCGKTGHTEERCWRKHGHCLMCGSEEHKGDNCPRFSLQEAPAFQPICSRCGGEHLGLNCQRGALI